MQTTDADKLFQTDAQLAKEAERRGRSQTDHKPEAANGLPLVLPSKPLALVVDGDDAFVAENGFIARRIDLKTASIKGSYRGHCGPVTCVAVHKVAAGETERRVLITGSWDQSIKIWDVETRVLLSSTAAHRDFVKCVHVVPGLDALASGSTDRGVRLWDLRVLSGWDWARVGPEAAERKRRALARKAAESSAAGGGDGNGAEEVSRASQMLGDLSVGPPAASGEPAPPGSSPPLFGPLPDLGCHRSHTRPVEVVRSIALLAQRLQGADCQDPDPQALAPDPANTHALLSADSMGVLKVWVVRPGPAGLETTLASSSNPHDTAIYDIQLGLRTPPGREDASDAQVWTASADSSVLLSALPLALPAPSTAAASAADLAPLPILRISHPYFVKSVCVLPFSLPSSGASFPAWLATGSTDETIRVFDLSALDIEDLPDPLPRTVRSIDSGAGGSAWCPGCGDGGGGWVGALKGHWHEVTSLACWVAPDGGAWLLSAGLDGTLRRWEIKERAEAMRAEHLAAVAGGAVGPPHRPQDKPEAEMELTAEEEAELAELLGE